MDLSFIFFIFAAFIVIPGTFFVLALFNKFLAAGIASLGMLVLFILFGIQFFNPDGTYVKQSVTQNWPPVINMCPDYLSLKKLTDGKYVCVDTIGVVYGNNGLQKYTSTTTDPNPNQQFDLKLSGTENDTDDKRRENIINECKSKKVTWEGIYDGLKSYKNVVPKPRS